MTTYKQLEEHLASPQFRRRLTYRTAERPYVSVDDVDSRQLGHMLETLTDAMIFMNRIGDESIAIHTARSARS